MVSHYERYGETTLRNLVWARRWHIGEYKDCGSSNITRANWLVISRLMAHIGDNARLEPWGRK